MNKTGKISTGWIINTLVAMMISLMINFSYLFMLADRSSGAFKPPKHYAYDNPGFILLEFLFYFAVSLALVFIFTFRVRDAEAKQYSFVKKLLLAGAITVACYFLSPDISPRHDVNIMAFRPRGLFNPMVVLKCSFTFVVAALYGKLYELIYQKQTILFENERLKNENLQSQYNVLVNQVNPHFFFNSLNSLSMLVRDDKKGAALRYIDRLSDTFRYIIQSGQNTMSTLRDELAFLDSYRYLFEVRYEGKLFFNVVIPEEGFLDRRLLSLSLQPLIENAVKHNTITTSRPFTITIRVEGDFLVVSNPVIPKLGEKIEGTGVGLTNLSNRYALMTGRDIEISEKKDVFTVKLPLS